MTVANVDTEHTPPTEPQTASMDALRADLDRLRQDFQSLSQNLRGAGNETAEAARQRVERAARALGDTARENLRQGSSALEAEIRDRPLTVLGVAFAVGLVIGRMMGR